MIKYYRVKEDTFLWEKGAIISNKDDSDGYKAIEDIWDACDCLEDEYITERIIKAQSDWFERVYSDKFDKLKFKTKEQLKNTFVEKFIK